MFRKQSAINNLWVLKIILTVSILSIGTAASGQDNPQGDATKIANAASLNEKPASPASKPATEAVPILTSFMDIKLGMPANEVRERLGNLKEKGDRQDYFVFSDVKTAQVLYDAAGKVIAISIDYFGLSNEVPSPEQILGHAVPAKADGSIYQLERYKDAGYWVAYSRTAGENPITTVTIQKQH